MTNDSYSQYQQPKETLKDKIKIYLAKEGPYILRAIIRFFVNIVVLLIKFIKHLLRTAYNTFRGNF